MKYDEDELAEAALLVAFQDTSRSMPAALEKKILAQGEAMVGEIRYSTTKGAAVSVEAEVEPIRPRRSALRTWGGWFAAAAGFALVVYQWRAHTLEREVAARAAATRSQGQEVSLSGLDGTTIATVGWDVSRRGGEIRISKVAPNGPGERYQLWLSASDAAHAVPAGAFSCDDSCTGRSFSFEGVPVDSLTGAFLTRSKLTDEASPSNPEQVVGQGQAGAL